MQPTPISNSTPLNTAINASAAAPSLPFDFRPSPFAAVFHAVLKGAGSINKIPTAGKTQDAGRFSAGITGPGNNSQALLPSGAAAIPRAVDRSREDRLRNRMRTLLPNFRSSSLPSAAMKRTPKPSLHSIK
jgi:hypothetical protein